jgi:hypothetical protein
MLRLTGAFARSIGSSGGGASCELLDLVRCRAREEDLLGSPPPLRSCSGSGEAFGRRLLQDAFGVAEEQVADERPIL